VYSSKLENLEEKNKFLDIYDQGKLNHVNINYVNISTAHNEIEAEVVSQNRKKKGPAIFCTELHQTLKKN
jgi:hypothetical protein